MIKKNALLAYENEVVVVHWGLLPEREGKRMVGFLVYDGADLWTVAPHEGVRTPRLSVQFQTEDIQCQEDYGTLHITLRLPEETRRKGN